MFPTHGIGLQLFQRLFGNKIRQIFALGIHLIKKYGTGRGELISQLLLYLVCGLHLPATNINMKTITFSLLILSVVVGHKEIP